MENQEFILKNVSEDLIEMYLDRCIEASEVCKCPRCKADIKAYALNNFQPKYVVTDKGDILVRVEMLSNQFRADVITAIISGIRVVMERPRHNT